MWYTYILECSDKTLYIGSTNNLEERLKRHNSGKASKYTRGRTPVKLLYKEKYKKKTDAMKREYEIKGFSRAKKLSLLTS